MGKKEREDVEREWIFQAVLHRLRVRWPGSPTGCG